MTKLITLGTIICLLTIFLTFSFKSADNEKKDYVTIYYNNQDNEISISYSNGTFRKVEFQKCQGFGDQTQLLKLISEHEALGYKLINYENEVPSLSYKLVTTVLLSK